MQRQTVVNLIPPTDPTPSPPSEDAIAEALEREKTRLLSDFVTATSHDLRTPLAIIRANAELCGMETDPERQRERLRKIDDQVLHLAHIIDQLHLMVSVDRLNALDVLPMCLSAAAREVAGEFMTRTGEKSVELVLELAPRLPIIEGDARWLYRAIRYLVENALRFTPAGGMITLRTFTRAPYVALEVADTGAGIPPDILPYIFERFYKGSRARTQDGSGAGLGLAVVKKIVMLHGGCVEAESVVDAGSTFRILLPPGTLTP